MTQPEQPARPQASRPAPPPPRRLDWGLTEYGRALERMRALHAEVAAGREPEALICLEHPPVITLGRHGRESNLRLAPEALAREGVGLFRVERGGDVTYHGPGQAVVYLLIDLKRRGLGVRPLVTLVEEAIIRAASRWGVAGAADPERPGVWVGGRKLAALGMAVRQGVSLHGLAINVATDLAAFDLINPCGLGLPVTSLAQELGAAPSMEAVFAALCDELAAGLGRVGGDSPT